MQSGYNLPIHEILSNRLLNQEMAKINVKVDKIIDEYDYLILGKFLLIKFKFFSYLIIYF
jgi:hypothetical protein